MSVFWSVFSRIWTEYGEIKYSFWIHENTDQNNSAYGHFSRSVRYTFKHFVKKTLERRHTDVSLCKQLVIFTHFKIIKNTHTTWCCSLFLRIITSYFICYFDVSAIVWLSCFHRYFRLTIRYFYDTDIILHCPCFL